MPNFKSFHFCLALLWLVACQILLSADVNAQQDSPNQDPFQRRRAVVMGFVHENHPKMEELLLTLEESNPPKFRTAVKRIGNTLLKMRSFENKQPERYLVLVELWKAKSEIEILTARLAKQDDPQLREQLNALVEVFVDSRKQILEIEKRNMEQRLERASRLLDEMETDRDAFVKKNLRSIDRTIRQLKSGKPTRKQTRP